MGIASIPQCRVMAMLAYCKVLFLVPTMVVAMPLAGQHKVLDTDKVVDLEGETVNMLDAFNLPDDARAFIFDHYLPEIRLATANTSFGILELGHFQLNTVGTLTKIIYAFMWQEYALTDNDIFLDPEVNILGASAMVSINKLADWLNDFPMLDPALQTGYGTYPGDAWCNPQEPHSKWHVESVNGLMDLMMLSDNMFRLTM